MVPLSVSKICTQIFLNKKNYGQNPKFDWFMELGNYS